LIFNAVRYTPANGKIIIRWFAAQDSIHMEVEDNGEGIPPHHLERITERFYRVSRDRGRDKGGTGLGLAIVKHVMKNHEGKLLITSEVGTGSLFACQFPNTLKITSEALPADISSEA
jgi:two-component system phosphate regulon sensor histidine kinase PhoR